jgi:hypothetical protein
LKVKDSEELMYILGSAFRAYSYKVGAGQTLEYFLPMIEGKSVDITVTLKDDASITVTKYQPVVEKLFGEQEQTESELVRTMSNQEILEPSEIPDEIKKRSSRKKKVENVIPEC